MRVSHYISLPSSITAVDINRSNSCVSHAWIGGSIDKMLAKLGGQQLYLHVSACTHVVRYGSYADRILRPG